ncbi:DUF6689 family protein [Thalassotalea fusca]
MLHFNKLVVTVSLIVFMLVSTLVQAREAITLDVQGNKVEATIHLAGEISADITLEFDNAVGLTEDSIGISAELVDTSALSFISRMPDLLNVSPAAAFPMLITIEPLASSGFAFSGMATIDIHTHNLEYTAGTPLRFFKAPLDGEFRDITMTMGSGSYRARGSIGRFSQFIIVADLRDPFTVVNQKLGDLQTALNAFSPQVEASVFTKLLQDINQVQQLINNQNYIAAGNRLNEFNRYVNQHSGHSIPDVWRSSRDIDNVAGELMAYANTLRFSLRLVN